ncbi:MAG TPA: N-6 DNA methylase, partial [Tissierellaceae bacterium]
MKNKYKIPFATKLVLRIIFIRFLIDRGVNLGYKRFGDNIEISQKEFLKVLEKKEELYALFQYLKNKFNGNLFELGEEINSESLTNDVFIVLKEFISGELILDNGQLSLFPMYDFNIISVELISNIYEILLGNEGQQVNKSFYTPTYIVDYMLSKNIEKSMLSSKSKTILDPSCGSGIFLVKAYRKIIEEKLKETDKTNIDKTLIDELKQNIFGVDLSPEAIDVSLFSLYLTILDYKDPKELENFKLPNLVGSNLFVSDFFDERLIGKIGYKKFDYILGNPPWGKIPQRTMEISKDFVLELDKYLHENSICSLVMPSKLLFNHKKPFLEFRKFLLENNLLMEVMDLSPVRKEIFKNAIAPASIITYRKSNLDFESTLKNKLTHISLKPNLYFDLFDLLVIEKNDIKYVDQNLLYKNDWVWKILLYGSSWDLDICLNLKNNFSSIGNVIEQVNKYRTEDEKIIYGTGLQLNGNNSIPEGYRGKLIIDSKTAIDRYKVDLSESKLFTADKVHRSRNPRLFEGPFSLVKKGISTRDFRMKAAYSDESFLFQETIRAIKGTRKDECFLKSITGILNSSLAAYVNILLHSSIGIEREQVFLEEILDFPYFFNDKLESQIANIVDEIQNSFEFEVEQGRNQYDLIKTIDELVLEAFNLKGSPYIDY